MTMTFKDLLHPQTAQELRDGSHESHAGYPDDVDGVSNSLSSIDEDSISSSLEFAEPAASWEDDSNSLCLSETMPSLLEELDTSMRSGDDSSAECCSYFEHASTSSGDKKAAEETPSSSSSSFLVFRLNYLMVTFVIMLSDGLQGKSMEQYRSWRCDF
jgi:hypothetical protein